MYMHRKIKSLMVLHGITHTAIAKQLKLSRITVSVVVGGMGKSRRIQQTIADALGMKFEDLWGENQNKKAA